MADKTELAKFVAESGLATSKAKALMDDFSDFFEIAEEWEVKAKTIVVTRPDQVAEMQMARSGRLVLKEKRIALEKRRKDLKEQSLRESRAIDGIANILKSVLVPIEEYLDAQEHWVEHQEALRETARREEADRLLKEKEEREAAEHEAEHERLRADNARLEKEQEVERREHEAEMAKQRELADRRAKTAASRARKEAEEAAAKREREFKAEQQRVLKAHEAGMRKLAEVKCPACGHVFDSREHKATHT